MAFPTSYGLVPHLNAGLSVNEDFLEVFVASSAKETGLCEEVDVLGVLGAGSAKRPILLVGVAEYYLGISGGKVKSSSRVNLLARMV